MALLSEETWTGWTAPGAQQAPKEAHQSVRKALERYQWPDGFQYRVFLQGSYKNSTNIRGDSDVDLVVEFTGAHYSDLNDSQKKNLGLSTSKVTLALARQHLAKALRVYYSPAVVDDSHGKVVKVKRSHGVVPADVLPAMTYRRYNSIAGRPSEFVSGIAFIDRHRGGLTFNFPEQHYAAGTRQSDSTHGRYKSLVRLLKNFREFLVGRGEVYKGHVSSYHLECLVFAFPPSHYQSTWRNTARTFRTWAGHAVNTDIVCPNGVTPLFDPGQGGWDRAHARHFVSRMQGWT